MACDCPTAHPTDADGGEDTLHTKGPGQEVHKCPRAP